MTPALYLIGRPAFDVEAFLGFLAEQGLGWARSEATGPEELVEATGRVCYMSFGERQSPRAFIYGPLPQNRSGITGSKHREILLHLVSFPLAARRKCIEYNSAADGHHG